MTQATISTRVRLRHKPMTVLLLALVAIAVAATLITIKAGTRTGRSAAAPSIKEPAYVNAISSMTKAELAAAFAVNGVRRSTPAASEDTYVNAIPFVGFDERYAKEVASLTTEQLAAAYGTGR